MSKKRQPKHKYGNACNTVVHSDIPKPEPLPYATIQKEKQKRRELSLAERAERSFLNKQKHVAGVYNNVLNYINSRGMVRRSNENYQHSSIIKKWR